jgi:hypothetical protein
VQVPLCKITREIVCGQGRRQSAGLLHCRFAICLGWFGRGITGRDSAAREAGQKA